MGRGRGRVPQSSTFRKTVACVSFTTTVIIDGDTDERKGGAHRPAGNTTLSWSGGRLSERERKKERERERERERGRETEREGEREKERET